MKFPSIKTLSDGFINTLKRFPFEVLFALIGTIAATIYIEQDEMLSYSFFTRLMMTANLGLLLSLSATLFVESRGDKKYWAAKLAVAVFAGCFVFIFNQQLRGVDWVRFFLLCLSFHLLVAYAPFTRKGHLQGFWQFNKTLFLRFLASVLYTVVLYGGIAAAIAASKLLFNLTFEYKIYGILFSWILGVFSTVFFLAGVPNNTAALDADETYPKGLKVFTQYVLIPLASVYVIILLAYEVKILIQWSLPKGLVSNLILGYAVFGILSILLIYPLRNLDGNKWIKTYARSFYFLLIPLLVLLFLAVYTRVLPYGITAPRYFLTALALWLLFITLYFLLSRKQNIKVIPISLSIVSLLAVYGPQSAFSIAQYSQRGRLAHIFKKYDAIKDGKLTSLKNKKVDKKDGAEAIAEVNYFVRDNDLMAMQPLITRDLKLVADSIRHAKEKGVAVESRRYIGYEIENAEQDWAISYLGITRFTETAIETPGYLYEVKNDHLLNTTGIDYALPLETSNYSDTGSMMKVGKIDFQRTVDQAKHQYTLSLNGEKVVFSSESIADSLIQSDNKLKAYYTGDFYGVKQYKLPNELLVFTKQTKHFKVTLQINDIRFSYSDNKNIEVSQVTGAYLITVLK